MYPANQPIDPNCLVHLSGSNGNRSMNGDSKEYIGSSQVKFEDKLTRDSIQIKCRLLATRLLAVLFDRIAFICEVDSNTKESPINVIIQYLSKQINFKSGLQRFCFALLMIEWAQLIRQDRESYSVTFETIKSQLATKIVACLDDENTIYFDEIALMFTRLQKECKVFLNTFGKMLTQRNLDLSGYLKLSVFTFEDVNGLTDLIQQKYLNTLSEHVLNSSAQTLELKAAVANLLELNQQTSQEQESFQLRSCFSLASASIELDVLCERMNPLIRPLIDCIRFESNQGWLLYF
jgi:hypothetical protein